MTDELWRSYNIVFDGKNVRMPLDLMIELPVWLGDMVCEAKDHPDTITGGQEGALAALTEHLSLLYRDIAVDPNTVITSGDFCIRVITDGSP